MKVASLRSRMGALRDRWLLAGLPSRTARLDEAMDDLKAQLAQLALAQRLPDAEPDLRVFSQWGEDGILAALIDQLRGIPRTFVEIGVEDYRECNTRLLARTGWTGLAIDGDQVAVSHAQTLREVWSGAVRVVGAWLEPSTVDAVVTGAGVRGEIGVLSIDVDGIDLYLLDALTGVDPWIVVIEYNARYGPRDAVTVPYRAGFDRRVEHFSWLHHGVSLAGVEVWGAARGYDLVAVNREGTNAFLVKSSRRPDGLPARSAPDLWRPLRFSENHGEDGAHRPISFDDERRIVAALPKVDVRELLTPDRTAAALEPADPRG